MSCDRIRQSIVLLLYGELPEGERGALERHVASCASCRVAVAEERRLHALLALRPPVEPSEDLLALCRGELARALRRGAPSAAPAQRRPAWWRLAIPSPAFALVFLAAGFLCGWVAVGQGLLPAEVPEAGSGRPGDAALDETANLTSLQAGPGAGKVNLTYDTMRRSSIEGRVSDPEIRRRLVETVRESPNEGMRLDAIDLLEGQVGDAEVRGALVGVLRGDRNAGARLKALAALGDRAPDDPQVRDAVTYALLQDDNPGVRIRAIDTLARAPDPRLGPVLERLARNDSDPYIRRRSGALAAEMLARSDR